MVRTPEHVRLEQARTGAAPWKAWGPYLAERQWGTVREDYSAGGDAWNYFTHDQARSRAYRWGEDGIAGICDDRQRLCLALALWNGADPILKERLFGLTNGEGNHGEDVKEYYFYLDSTPTHSYMKCLYKYPQRRVPVRATSSPPTRAAASRTSEYELLDTGVFDDDRYFDVVVEYAKAAPDDILMRVTAHNRGPDAATLHLLPTLWFRNTWSWGDAGRSSRRWRPTAGGVARVAPRARRVAAARATARPSCCSARTRRTTSGCSARRTPRRIRRTRSTTTSSTGTRRGQPGPDGHEVRGPPRARGRRPAAARDGPRAADRGGAALAEPLGATSTRVLRHAPRRGRRASTPRSSRRTLDADRALVMRQALAGLLWSKQYYEYDVHRWLREHGVNPWDAERAAACATSAWFHMVAGDVISMPDKWEYPWFAAWDLAFHCAPLSLVDVDFAKEQVELLLRTRYHAPQRADPGLRVELLRRQPAGARLGGAVRSTSARRRSAARATATFLERVFQRLLTNFTWWVNRKDPDGRNLFQGGFLGLDNIGIFDRSAPLPGGGTLEQADGTAWMALYCQWMLQIAVELAREDPAYVDIALKFVTHFAWIAIALNPPGADTPLWDEEDGFFYDVHADARRQRRSRSRCARSSGCCRCARRRCSTRDLARAPPEAARARAGVRRALRRRRAGARAPARARARTGRRLLALVDEAQLRQILAVDARRGRVPRAARHPRDLAPPPRPAVPVRLGRPAATRSRYLPAESDTGMFGGNSNWRGPVWFPMNLVILRGAAPAAPLLRRRLQGRVPDRLRARARTCARSRARSPSG